MAADQPGHAVDQDGIPLANDALQRRRQTLQELGCRVEEAGTGGEAVNKFNGSRDALSAAIVDLGLSDQSGDEVIRQMRGSSPDLPIVLATGFVDGPGRRHWSNDSRVYILEKPYQPDNIKAALENLGVLVR